jgi:hypothetical protein
MFGLSKILSRWLLSIKKLTMDHPGVVALNLKRSIIKLTGHAVLLIFTLMTENEPDVGGVMISDTTDPALMLPLGEGDIPFLQSD